MSYRCSKFGFGAHWCFQTKAQRMIFPIYEAELLVCLPKFIPFVCFEANNVSQQVPLIKPQTCECTDSSLETLYLPCRCRRRREKGPLLLSFLALVAIFSHGCGPLTRACCLTSLPALRGLVLPNPKIYGCILNENYI